MSLVATANANGVEPLAYLTHCLTNHRDLAERPARPGAPERMLMANVDANETGVRDIEGRSGRVGVGATTSAPPAKLDPADRFRRNLAVVIGIDRYGEGIPQLRSAVSDARAIATVLSEHHGFEIWQIFDRDASRDRLRDLFLEQLPAALAAQDRLLVYFAGHGITLASDHGPTGYFVPADARRSDPTSFLSMKVMADGLDKLTVHHMFVVLDCCLASWYCQASERAIAPMAAAAHDDRYHSYTTNAAHQLLTSVSNDELALDVLARGRFEGDHPHSPFARALLEGLRGGADYTRDNLITASELAMFVRDGVERLADQAAARQTPQLSPICRHGGGEFVFRVPA